MVNTYRLLTKQVYTQHNSCTFQKLRFGICTPLLFRGASRRTYGGTRRLMKIWVKSFQRRPLKSHKNKYDTHEVVNVTLLTQETPTTWYRETAISLSERIAAPKAPIGGPARWAKYTQTDISSNSGHNKTSPSATMPPQLPRSQHKQAYHGMSI